MSPFTNTAHIVETALLLLGAYLLGCILGYGIHRILHAARGTRQPATQSEVAAVASAPRSASRPSRSPAARLAATVDEPLLRPAVKPVAVPTRPTNPPAIGNRPAKEKSPDARPPALPEARDGKADNLKKIKGIGPKIEASLYALGVFHVDQIAGWSKANAEWVEAHLAFKGRIRRERWIEQAVELTRTSADA